MNIYVLRKMDFDNEVIDVSIVVDDAVCWVKGFDDVDWRDAENFATELATQLNVSVSDE
jgi:hypothetical protein